MYRISSQRSVTLKLKGLTRITYSFPRLSNYRDNKVEVNWQYRCIYTLYISSI